MGKPPAFQLYAADFYMDTASWTPEAVGFYFRLLIYEWVNGFIPMDMDSIARITGSMENRKWKANVSRIWRECCHKFVTFDGPNGDKVYKNLRLEQEREKQNNYKELQAEKGRKKNE